MKLLKKFSPPESVDSAVISPDNNFIATSNSLVGDIWIMDMQGNLVQTLETELSGASDSNMIIWQDNYIITLADSKTCVYVWDSKNFALINKYKAHSGTYIRKIFYRNNQLYLIIKPKFLKKDEWEKGSLINEPNFWKINLSTQEIQKEIWQNKSLLSGFATENNDIILFGNQLTNPYHIEWSSSIFKESCDLYLINQSSINSLSCENVINNDWIVAYETELYNYKLFYFNYNENKIIEKTNSKLEYLAIASYQDSFLCLIFDKKTKSHGILNIKDDTITPLKKEASTAFFVSENKILIGLNNDIYLMEL